MQTWRRASASGHLRSQTSAECQGRCCQSACRRQGDPCRLCSRSLAAAPNSPASPVRKGRVSHTHRHSCDTRRSSPPWSTMPRDPPAPTSAIPQCHLEYHPPCSPHPSASSAPRRCSRRHQDMQPCRHFPCPGGTGRGKCKPFCPCSAFCVAEPNSAPLWPRHRSDPAWGWSVRSGHRGRRRSRARSRRRSLAVTPGEPPAPGASRARSPATQTQTGRPEAR
mmetsp:Transcript_65224/g.169483  ORF Transcript_65224/g.169483 Transcript_65224/m.169483 type:complete len:222 (+) Transcript_65224:1124-1789(+)